MLMLHQAYRGDKKIINGILGIEKIGPNREKKRKNAAGRKCRAAPFTMPALRMRPGVVL
jgi:hypothetical protein